ncbi:prolyl oligopeptidase family serine peptidase [Streptomyces sp. NPDC054766]
MPPSPFTEAAPGWLSLGVPAGAGALTGLALSADGMLVAATLVAPDPAADRDRATTWIRSTAASAAWTRLDTGCTELVFAPTGRRLLGLARAEEGQVCVVIDPDAGTAVRATPPMISGGAPVWHPQGNGFAWSCAALPDGPRPLHRTRRLGFDLDGRGWLGEDVRQVHVFRGYDGYGGFGPGDEKPTVIESPTDCRHLSWAPDGRTLHFVTERHDERFRDFGAQLFGVDLDSGHERQLTEPDLVAAASLPLPGGAVACVALTRAAGCGSVGAVYTVDPESGERVLRLTDPAACDIAHPLTSYAHGLAAVGGLLVTVQLARGAMPLLLLDPERPGRQRRMLDGPCEVHAYDAGPGGIAALVRSGATAEDVLFLPAEELPEPAATVLPVPPATTWQTDGTPRLRPLDIAGIDAWLVTPEGPEPAPLVVWLHGGPGAQAGWTVPPDVQRLAAHGYAGLYLNPRGAAGRGEDFTAALLGGPGTIDLDDVAAALDAVVGLPGIDQDRVGVHGVSYGGYLAALLWSRTPLIKAAVVERAIVSWDFHRTGSDLGIPVTDGYWRGGPGPGQRPDPLTVPLHNSSPVLVLAGELDRRCPPAECQLLFGRLVEEGVPAEFAVLADCGHSVGAAPPSVRRARGAALLDWWTTQLPGTAATSAP